MTKLNSQIAEALNMDLPDEANSPGSIDYEMTVVSPTELPKPVENEQLPDMTDIDTRLLEGEKQLEVLIEYGISNFRDLLDQALTTEPKYRSRALEVVSNLYSNTLDAIKHKTELQIKKKDTRMKEKSFTGGSKTSNNTTNNNIFVGSREDFLKLLDTPKAKKDK